MEGRPRILVVDAVAGLTAGVLVLALHGPISRLYDWSVPFTLFMGAVNLLYGSYSSWVARRSGRPATLVFVLAGANILWGTVCFGLAWWLREQASVLGVLHLVAEGLFVGGLGVLEWRRGSRGGDHET